MLLLLGFMLEEGLANSLFKNFEVLLILLFKIFESFFLFINSLKFIVDFLLFLL
jgi:hypothetical protein